MGKVDRAGQARSFGRGCGVGGARGVEQGHCGVGTHIGAVVARINALLNSWLRGWRGRERGESKKSGWDEERVGGKRKREKRGMYGKA